MSDNLPTQPSITIVNQIVADSWQLYRKYWLAMLLTALTFFVAVLLMLVPLYWHFINTVMGLAFYFLAIFIIPSYVWAVYLLRIYHKTHLQQDLKRQELRSFMTARLLHVYAALLVVNGMTEIVVLLVKPFPQAGFVAFAAFLPIIAYTVAGESIIKALQHGFRLFYRHPLVVLLSCVLPFTLLVGPMVLMQAFPHVLLYKIIGDVLALMVLAWIALLVPWCLTTSLTLQQTLDPASVAAYRARMQ